MRTLRTEDNFLINLDKVECFELHSITDFCYEIRGHMGGFPYMVYTICYTIPELATETECANYANKVFAKFQCWISDDVPCKNIYQFRDMLFSDFTDDEEGNERYKWLCNQG